MGRTEREIKRSNKLDDFAIMRIVFRAVKRMKEFAVCESTVGRLKPVVIVNRRLVLSMGRKWTDQVTGEQGTYEGKVEEFVTSYFQSKSNSVDK